VDDVFLTIVGNTDLIFPKARKAGNVIRLSQPFPGIFYICPFIIEFLCLFALLVEESRQPSEFEVKSTIVGCKGGDIMVCFSAYNVRTWIEADSSDFIDY
jgi:hypothetical protein